MIDVAGRRDDAKLAGHDPSTLVELVALQRVQDRAGDVRDLAGCHRSHIEEHVIAFDAAEDRRAPGPQARGERRPVGHADPNPQEASAVPGVEPPPTLDSHGTTCAPSRSPSSASASRAARRWI